MRRAVIIITVVLTGLLLISGCADTDSSLNSVPETKSVQEIPSSSGEIFAMDTYMTVTCYGNQCDEALQEALEEIRRLDELLSVGADESEISRINSAGSGVLSEDSNVMIKKSLELYHNTDGAFDITVYPLMKLWGFTSGNFAVPDKTELTDLLEYTGSNLLEYDEATYTLTLDKNQGVDLGGIAKGYASDRIMEIFASYGLSSGMVSLGGNVQCYGTKPDGSLWRVGIQNPLKPDDGTSFLGVLSVADKAVITSGAYERYFVDEATGETYHHILDPKTGYPANNGLISVTIVSSNGMLADGLSTSCYVMGLDGSISYWQEHGDDFDMILMTDNGEIYVTETISEDFSSEFTINIIQKEA